MKKFQNVKPARAQDYEKAMPSLHFEFSGDTLQRVMIDTPLGPLRVSVQSYSVMLEEPATRKVYRVTIVDSMGQFPDTVKDFEEEYARNSFKINFDDCHCRFSLAVSDFEEPAL
jgi:hypothetical protein